MQKQFHRNTKISVKNYPQFNQEKNRICSKMYKMKGMYQTSINDKKDLSK